MGMRTAANVECTLNDAFAVALVFDPNAGGTLMCRPIVNAAISSGATSKLPADKLEPLWRHLLSHFANPVGLYEEEVRMLGVQKHTESIATAGSCFCNRGV